MAPYISLFCLSRLAAGGRDPESKGKIEAVVKYIKNNFLVARTYFGLDALNSDGLKWLERVANAKIHDTTKMVPARVFTEERRILKDVPTLSEPPKPNVAIVRKTNVVHYKQNRYEVPKVRRVAADKRGGF
jgi:hypothetical protein